MESKEEQNIRKPLLNSLTEIVKIEAKRALEVGEVEDPKGVALEIAANRYAIGEICEHLEEMQKDLDYKEVKAGIKELVNALREYYTGGEWTIEYWVSRLREEDQTTDGISEYLGKKPNILEIIRGEASMFHVSTHGAFPLIGGYTPNITIDLYWNPKTKRLLEIREDQSYELMKLREKLSKRL